MSRFCRGKPIRKSIRSNLNTYTPFWSVVELVCQWKAPNLTGTHLTNSARLPVIPCLSSSASLTAIVDHVVFAYKPFVPTMAPPPFVPVSNCESSSQVVGFCLFELDGESFCAVIQRPAAVVVQNERRVCGIFVF